jgi:hypothetical protein
MIRSGGVRKNYRSNLSISPFFVVFVLHFRHQTDVFSWLLAVFGEILSSKASPGRCLLILIAT